MKIKRDVIYSVIIVLLIATCAQFYYDYEYKPQAARRIEVYYNHDIRANEQIIRLIQDADQFIHFSIYTFTRPDIKDALLGAKHRGLDVRGVVDQEQTNQIEIQRDIVAELRNAGIPIELDDNPGIMHLKTLVTEKAYASGSYNWTASATDSNDEVLEIGYDNDIREKYEHIVDKLFEKYQP
jgi:phosphatidylserine/phosphatidylglycerophosphate/cardiolipin synthase-like enzyme